MAGLPELVVFQYNVWLGRFVNLFASWKQELRSMKLLTVGAMLGGDCLQNTVRQDRSSQLAIPNAQMPAVVSIGSPTVRSVSQEQAGTQSGDGQPHKHL